MTSSNNLHDSPLGKPSGKSGTYDPSLLFSIPRFPMRESLGITGTVPFFGMDIWNIYELSWLNLRGKPQIAIASVIVSSDSPHIVESKSLKLYLNSFAQTRIAGEEALLELLHADLSATFGAPVQIKLTKPDTFSKIKLTELDGLLLDRLDIEVNEYSHNPSFLRANTDEAPVEEVFISHLLKTNCPVTGQPDWASVQIQYVGYQINQEGLLKYLISLREHDEFHEQCVERIFTDILRYCKPNSLAVYARYTRRGGIDINPWRSNFSSGKGPLYHRNARQ